jgi:hypothetical protein
VGSGICAKRVAKLAFNTLVDGDLRARQLTSVVADRNRMCDGNGAALVPALVTVTPLGEGQAPQVIQIGPAQGDPEGVERPRPEDPAGYRRAKRPG